MNTVIRIAIADDHTILRKGIAEILGQWENFKVIYDTGNGKELIDRINASPEKPDICLLDINMPVMDGYETAREIKKNWPEINILALSMFDNEFNIIKMLRCGAGGYLLKGAEPAELKRAIEKITSDGFYHSELVTGRVIRMIQNGNNALDNELDEKEVEFLKLACSELTYKEIAAQMHKSPRTIDGYRDSLFAKLNITNRTGLVIYAIKTGLCMPV